MNFVACDRCDIAEPWQHYFHPDTQLLCLPRCLWLPHQVQFSLRSVPAPLHPDPLHPPSLPAQANRKSLVRTSASASIKLTNFLEFSREKVFQFCGLSPSFISWKEKSCSCHHCTWVVVLRSHWKSIDSASSSQSRGSMNFPTKCWDTLCMSSRLGVSLKSICSR